MDPVVTLAYVAAAGRRIRLGTSVLIMPYYTPIVLAKALTTLDVLCRGRLNVGLGIGWSKDEYDAVGVPYRQRGKRADEFLSCLRAIWTDDVVEFRGEFYHVPRAKVAPKPVQEPHPPITLGGYGPVMIHRAVTLADGFSGGNVPLDEVRPLVREIRAAAEAAGRDPATLQIVSRGTLRLHDTPQGANRRPNPVDNLSVRSALGAGRNLAQPPARVYRQSCPPPRQMPASSARPTGLRRIGSPFNVVSPQCSL